MEFGKKYGLITLALAGSALLTACGGGGSADGTTPQESVNNNDTALGAYYFSAYTKNSGVELWMTDGTEEGTRQVKEINEDSSSNPESFIQTGGTVFFLADDNVNGRELWKADTDGNVAMVKDINPGEMGCSCEILGAGNGKIYFYAYDGGYALWQSDGTNEGTVKIGNFGDVGNLVVTDDGMVWFTSNTRSSTQNSLWRYDGLTVPDAPITAGSALSNIEKLTKVENKVFFIGTTSSEGSEIWVSDGTAAGTRITRDIISGSGSGISDARYVNLQELNGKLVFTDGNYRSAMWLSDGTEAGTVRLMSTSGTTPSFVYTYNYAPLYTAGNDLYFVEYSSSSVWRTDGTGAETTGLGVATRYRRGTFRVHAANGSKVFLENDYKGFIYDRSDDSVVAFAEDFSGVAIRSAAVGSSLFQIVENSENRQKSYFLVRMGIDGVVETLRQVDDDTILFAGNDRIYMSFKDGKEGREPWVSDGTAEGTRMLADINKTPIGDSAPREYAVMNGEVYFVAEDADENEGLWRTVTDSGDAIQLTPKEVYRVSEPTVSAGRVYFAAKHEEFGEELWVTDGTVAGTRMVADMSPGYRGIEPYSLVDANGELYFIDDSEMLWKTRGSAETTRIVAMLDDGHKLFAYGKSVYFAYNDRMFSHELWKTDGDFSTTRMIKNISPTGRGVDGDVEVVFLRGKSFFAAKDEGGEVELWMTDGSEEGTRKVVQEDGVGVPLDSYPVYIVAGDTLLFTGYDAAGDMALWQTSETGKASQFLSLTGDGASIPTGDYVEKDGVVYFSMLSELGPELWKTDGTIEGTIKIRTLADASTGGIPESLPLRKLVPTHHTGTWSKYVAYYGLRGMYFVGDTLFFIANDVVSGSELWKSDGTAEGTVMVKDIQPGEGSGAWCLLCDNKRYYSEY